MVILFENWNMQNVMINKEFYLCEAMASMLYPNPAKMRYVLKLMQPRFFCLHVVID